MILQSAAQLYKIGMKGANAAKGTLKDSHIGKVADATEEALYNGTKKLIKSQKYGPITNAKEIDGTTKRAENLWTRKKLNPAWVVGASGAYIAGSNMKSSMEKQTLPLKLATMNPTQYGAPDIMSYDGVAQNRAPKNMNADGSLVFGLHNMRRG
jgi:hypothetical protein